MADSFKREMTTAFEGYTQMMLRLSNSTYEGGIITATTSPEIPVPPMYLLVVVTLLYGLIFVTGVAGNSLVIFVLWYHRDMRSYTNWLLGNLSLADLLVILVCMPTAVLDLYAREVWYLGLVMCKLVPFLENAVSTSSVLTILAISVERYHAICRPLQAHAGCSAGRMLRIITAIWITAVVTCVPFFVITVHKDSTFLDGTPIKVCRTYIGSGWQRVYVLSLSAIMFFLALFLLLALYGLLLRRLLRVDNLSRRLPSSTPSSTPSRASVMEDARDRARRQSAFMVLAVIVLFFVCLLPMQIVRLLLVLSPGRVLSLGFEGYLSLIYIVRVMFYLNSMVNPLCYNILSSRFRQAFLRVCGCGRAPRLTYPSTRMTSYNSHRGDGEPEKDPSVERVLINNSHQ